MTKSHFNEHLRSLRELNKIPQRQLANLLDIDTPMYSRIERGERKAKREQVIALGKFLKDENLLNLWLADKVIHTLAYEENPEEILSIVSEQLMEYGTNKRFHE